MNYNIVKDTPDLRDKIFVPSVIKNVSQLPSSVDLRPLMSPIVNQGELGSCTANAIVSGLREYIELRTNLATFVRLSRLFLYYEERVIEKTVNSDSGAQIRDGMSVLQKIGVCPELLDPYIINIFTNKPTVIDLQTAGKYKISNYYRVNTLNDLKLALAEGLPVVLGIMVYESFESDSVAKTGLVPMPNISQEQLLGGHAVCAVGYNDNKGYVVVRNSWGVEWGDKGYFYLPYSYIVPNLTTDMWTGY